MEREHNHQNRNTYTIHFEPGGETIQVPTGLLLSEAMRQAGLDLNMPCGGQGRCGRCAVIVHNGSGVRRRSTLRLSTEDLAAGYALACQTVIEGDAVLTVPPQEKIERRLVSDKTAARITLPFTYNPDQQSLRLFPLNLDPPSMADQTDDWSRLKRALATSYGPDNFTVDLLANRPEDWAHLKRELETAFGLADFNVDLLANRPEDWVRLKRALTVPYGLTDLTADLATVRRLGTTLRERDWAVTAVIELDTWDRPNGPPRLVDLQPSPPPPQGKEEGLWGVAVDIGTTTVSLYLVDLLSGEVVAKAAEYNGQIKRGEDVISRIIYAGKNNGLQELQELVVGTINELIGRASQRAKINPQEIYKMTVAGNSTMIHLLLGLPPASIRLEPFITAINQPPALRAGELGLNIHPQATVDCLPGVASYVGADITAGVVGSRMCTPPSIPPTGGDRGGLTLFLDVGTNGEMVLGDGEWLISCACSAGPAFEGAGVQDGMRATAGAIEEVWINSETFEPTYRVIPQPKLEAQGRPTPPRGICGSGLISLLAEMFITDVIDKAGNLNITPSFQQDEKRRRIRQGAHGPEYVVAWADETEHGQDIVITKVDIDNLRRAKGAIYAGYTVLAESVGVELAAVDRMLIGGAFGQYINVEKAVQIGLLPDLSWERFHFLGNTALQGALLALLNRDYRAQVTEVAAKMTYLELSADNAFYEQFTSALFLPHTDINKFPTVAAMLD
ncbi:MAG: DUF4445 domain-containing protein [Anaerolineae bacterium]|nr:DUF4445 domain-containing protein [Anaerolineae bacterium]